MNKLELWERYKKYLCVAENLGLQLDISRMMFDEDFLERMSGPIAEALEAMDRLEKGAIANIDEHRMVGHYWLRAPELAPTPEIKVDIEQTIASVKAFAADVHRGTISPERGDGFYVLLLIGIGGSTLGPQFVADALGNPDDPMIIRFIDNTDPDGIDRVLGELDEALAQTLTVVTSKSGRTIETRNAMLEVEHAYRQAGLSFPKHAVAITCEGTPLHKKATEEKWLGTFPMWDWIGGRTSVTSAVGLLPAALQGIDIDALLAGARDCDAVTRSRDWRQNPAALLALMWYCAGDGRGTRDMVILPYCDRLALFGKYLQQLVMESLGKKLDREGQVVHQGFTVYGNKGSTDQHAYMQQLTDGPDNFFVTFVDVRRKRNGQSIPVEEDVTTADYLTGFRLGTRAALTESGRKSVTITLDELDPRALGVLIALFERAVSLYAELINVNAYHQPGVEAGKKAAGQLLNLQHKILGHLRANLGSTFTIDEIALGVNAPGDIESVRDVVEHIQAHDDHAVTCTSVGDPPESRYGMQGMNNVPESRAGDVPPGAQA